MEGREVKDGQLFVNGKIFASLQNEILRLKWNE
jgi:hypothetical protein